MKKIIALLIAVFMLSVAAYAADVTVTADDITYDGVSDTIVYTIKTTNAAGAEFGGNLTFDTTVFSFNTSSEPASIKWFAPKSRVSIVGAKTDSDITITLNVLNKEAAKAGAALTLSGAKVAKDGETLFSAAEIVTMVQGAAGQKEAPVYTEVTDGEGVFAGADVTYTGVWTGAYTITLNGNEAEEVKVDFDADHSYKLNSNVKGEGTIAFKIAVIGAPKNAKAVPSVFGTEWVAAVKAAE